MAAAAVTAASSQAPSLTLPAATAATLSPRPFLLSHLQRTPPIRPNGRKPSAFRAPYCSTSSLTHCFGSAVVRVGDTAVACGIQGEILHAKDIADPPRRQYQRETRESAQDKTSRGPNSYDKNSEGDDEREEQDAEDLRHLNLLVPNIDLATGCSPAHLPGMPPSHEAQTLAHRLYELLHSSRVVCLDDLRISSTTAPPPASPPDDPDAAVPPRPPSYWTLYISLTVLSLSGTTALIDALWAATLAALADVRLPAAWWDAGAETVLCADAPARAARLRLRGRPAVASWGVVEGHAHDGFMRPTDADGDDGDDDGDGDDDDAGKDLGAGGRRAWLLADPDAWEDALCRETVTVALDCSRGGGDRAELLRVEKSGGGAVGLRELRELLGPAEERWRDWDRVLPASGGAR